MQIPKKVLSLIEKRAKLASKLQEVNFELDEWLDKHQIDVESEDYRGGVELFEDPYGSAERVLEAIAKKGENNTNS